MNRQRTSGPGAPRRVPWPALVLIGAAALLPRAWHMQEAAPPAGSRSAPAAAAPARPSALPVPVAVAPAAAVAPRPATNAPLVTDANAPDLRRLHDQYADRADPRARRMAARAFNACVPLFVAARGETPSAEALVAALPVRDHAEREQALRTLYARCHGFAGERAETLAAMDRRWRDDRAAADPGDRALDALLDGDTPAAEQVLGVALTAGDPASVAALSGIATRVAAVRDGGGLGADRRRAEAVDAALPLVACDLGLDCSAQSLAALQLCALHAACDGDLAARLAAGRSGVDAAAVELERARLRALLASGAPFTLDDLLPAGSAE